MQLNNIQSTRLHFGQLVNRLTGNTPRLKYATIEQKKDEAFVLTFKTWKNIKHADSSLLENETFLFKAYYITNDLDRAKSIPAIKDCGIKNPLKITLGHLLLNDPYFLLNYMKKNGNNYPNIRLPKKKLQTACMGNDELLELIELDRPKFNPKQEYGQYRVRKKMPETFWIPLATQSNKAAEYWIKENSELKTYAELIYVTTTNTKNFFFFEQAEKSVKKDIITLTNYYQDLTFTKRILNTIEEPSNHELKNTIPTDVISRIIYLTSILFIQDFIQDLEEIVTHMHEKGAKEKSCTEMNAVILDFKNIAGIKKPEIFHPQCFITKIKIARILRNSPLLDIKKGFFKDITAIQNVYKQNYHGRPSPLELHYLDKSWIKLHKERVYCQ